MYKSRGVIRPRTSVFTHRRQSSETIQKILEKYCRPVPERLRQSLQASLPSPNISKQQFNVLNAIGKGGFGRVWKVQLKRTKQQFAMKEMLKLRVVSKRSVHSVMNERQLLETLRHPLIVNMHSAFQDREHLYLVLDLKAGGDLRFHFSRHRRFTELQTQFFVACLVQALEFLHKHRVIHRDIKPENLVLDSSGYLHITDFGIARVITEDNAKDTSGTPGYMAPEVLVRQNHSIGVDHFAVGVMAYEFMLGRRPYLGRNRKEIRDHVLSKQVRVLPNEVLPGWSAEAVDFVNQLIQRKPSRRLGCGGTHQLKSHPWLRDFPWEDLMSHRLEAPFLPQEENNFDARVTSDWTDEIDHSLSLSSVQHLFAQYTYEPGFNHKHALG